MKRALGLSLVALFVVASCQDTHGPGAAPDPRPFFDIEDGHSDPARSQFFFLAPIRRFTQHLPSSGFNPSLSPIVQIRECALNADQTGCGTLGPVVKTLTMTDPSALDRIYVLPAFREYAVLWRTRFLTDLNSTKFYRLSVKVGSSELGFADVDPVSSGKELKNLQTGDVFGLVDGRTLPSPIAPPP